MSVYAALFRKTTWPGGPLEVEFESGETPPAEALISNIKAVPFTGPDQWVVIQLEDGAWEIPGGTVDRGESPLETLRRELIEEAGAKLIRAAYIGAWKMRSLARQPFRPHLPHPVSYRVVYLCQVELVGPPKIPAEGGEQVAAVKQVNLEQAVHYFHQVGRADLADLYRFASVMGEEYGII